MVFAYINRGAGGETLDSHYTFQIRTFWICSFVVAAMVAFLIAYSLQVVGVSFLSRIISSGGLSSLGLPHLLFGAVGVGVFVWWLFRVINGLVRINRSDPVENPQTLWV